MLAAVVALAGGPTPMASAHDAMSSAGGVAQTRPAPSSDSSEWLIGVGAVGGVALISAGIAGSRRTNRKTAAAASRVRGASGA
jgi:hypothetical protein